MNLFNVNGTIGSNLSIEEKWREFWSSFKISIKIQLLISSLIVFAVYFKLSDLNALDNKAFFYGDINKGFVYDLIFLIVAASIEEVVFRLHIDFQRKHILVSLLASVFFLFLKIDFLWFLVIGNLLVIYISSFFKSLYESQRGWFLNIYIIVTSFIFAIAHTHDFSIINKYNFVVFVLILLIRMINGILLCRIRLKNNGLEWSIGLHILLNFIPFIIAFIGGINN